MYLKIKDELYDVEIVKKMRTRNTYIRVKDDLTIYVTTNRFVPDWEIERILKKRLRLKERKMSLVKIFIF